VLHLQGLESPLIPYALELADKAAAACCLEARYPFFDRRLMEFCLALPAEQKLRSGWNRSLLRRAMQGILPPEVQWRNNKADLSPNFRRNLLTLDRWTVERILAEDEKIIKEFVDVAALDRLYQRYRKSTSNSDSMTLFLAVTFAAWMRQSGITKLENAFFN
jgi:asparagine synthase (glutamine-hydrolysing)